MARRRYSHRSISITAAVCYSPRGTDDAMVNPLAALELPVPLLSEQIKQDSDGTCRVSDAEEDDEQVGLTPEVVNMREVELAGSPLSVRPACSQARSVRRCLTVIPRHSQSGTAASLLSGSSSSRSRE